MLDPLALHLATDPQTAADWGRALEFRRLAIDLSQQKLADLTGLKRSEIDNLESGIGWLRTLRHHSLFEALGCDVKPIPTATLKALLRSRFSRLR